MIAAAKRIIRNEPVAVFEAFKALILSTLGLGPAFDWWHLTDTQLAVIIAEYVALTGFATVFVRSQVVPAANVALTRHEAGLVELGQSLPPKGT